MSPLSDFFHKVAERLEKAAETWAAGKGDSRRESKSSVREVPSYIIMNIPKMYDKLKKYTKYTRTIKG